MFYDPSTCRDLRRELGSLGIVDHKARDRDEGDRGR